MLSEAAKARAVRRGPGALGFLLAHHWPDQLDRCYLTWIGQRPLWFCARCCGLYPVLFMVLALLLMVDIPGGWWDLLWLFLLPLPALLDWILARLSIRLGTNKGRTFWGMFIGASLGRTVYLNMIHPATTLVVVQLSLLIGAVILVEVVRLFLGRTGELGS